MVLILSYMLSKKIFRFLYFPKRIMQLNMWTNNRKSFNVFIQFINQKFHEALLMLCSIKFHDCKSFFFLKA